MTSYDERKRCQPVLVKLHTASQYYASQCLKSADAKRSKPGNPIVEKSLGEPFGLNCKAPACGGPVLGQHWWALLRQFI